MAIRHNGVKSEHFKLERLGDGVYAALYKEGGLAASNAGIVDMGDRTLVFDTFFSPQAAADLRIAAEELTGRPVALVVNSHWHHDHTWGNQAFAPETIVVSTDRTRRLIATAGVKQVEVYERTAAETLAGWQAQLNDACDARQRRQCANWIDYFRCAVEARPILQLRLPDLTFEKRLAVHGSQRQAELLAFAGHTEDDLVLYLPDDGVVFLSDLHFVGYHPYLGAGHPDQLLQSLRELQDLAADTFVPGHGAVGRVDGVSLVSQYVEMMQEIAHQLVAAGEPEEKIAEQSIPSPFNDWLYASFFHENLSVLYKQAAST